MYELLSNAVAIDLVELEELTEAVNNNTEILHTELQSFEQYYQDQIELMKINNSISLSILVFSGACLGAAIFRHLRK